MSRWRAKRRVLRVEPRGFTYAIRWLRYDYAPHCWLMRHA